MSRLLMLPFMAAVFLFSSNCGSSQTKERQTFQEGPVKFSFEVPSGFAVLPPDSISWVELIPSSDGMGKVVFYYPQESDRGISSAHIRVEYFSKNLPSSGSITEVFTWLKSLFMNETRNGILLYEKPDEKTLDGHSAALMSIRIPDFLPNNDTALAKVGGKSMSWGYIDHGDWWIALNMTVADEVDYPRMDSILNLLVHSYKKEE